MELKNYWFALKSHIYVEFKENEILLYDTQSGNRAITILDEPIVLVTQLYEPKNLGVILVNAEKYSNPHIRNFIQEMVNKEMGDLMEVESFCKKPIRLVPILNLQKDIEKHKNNKDKVVYLGKNISRYLLEINIYINDICGSFCGYCDRYSKQIRCCMAHGTNNELSLGDLERLLNQLRYSSISTINLLGGDIFKYSHLSELQGLFASSSKILHCYVHYKNYQKNEFVDSQKLELIITFPIDEKSFQKVWTMINKENTKLHYVIESEEQYSNVEYLIEKFGIENYEIHPFFTEKNIDFFETTVFLNEEDIFMKTFQMREIFRNQKLNANFFGTLYVLPDGSVKANMNTPVLGNISTNELLDITYKELIDNTAWRTIRDSQPCNECIYHFFCPPPSDYERVIGRNNLCHVKSLRPN